MIQASFAVCPVRVSVTSAGHFLCAQVGPRVQPARPCGGIDWWEAGRAFCVEAVLLS